MLSIGKPSVKILAQERPTLQGSFEVFTRFWFSDKRGFTHQQKWFYLFSPWILFTDIVRNSFDPLPHYGHCPCICRFLFKTRSQRKASKNGIYVYNQKEGNGKRSPAVPQWSITMSWKVLLTYVLQSVKCYKVLQSAKCYEVLRSVTKCCKVQNATKWEMLRSVAKYKALRSVTKCYKVQSVTKWEMLRNAGSCREMLSRAAATLK